MTPPNVRDEFLPAHFAPTLEQVYPFALFDNSILQNSVEPMTFWNNSGPDLIISHMETPGAIQSPLRQRLQRAPLAPVAVAAILGVVVGRYVDLPVGLFAAVAAAAMIGGVLLVRRQRASEGQSPYLAELLSPAPPAN